MSSSSSSSSSGSSSNTNIAELWVRLQKASRQERELIVNSLDKATIEKLRTEINPYKKPIYSGSSAKQHRTLAFYTIPLNEKYSNRFAMTSLIGFLYRMLDEYEPPCEFKSEKDYEFAKLFETKAKEEEYQLTCEKYDKLIDSEEDEQTKIELQIKKQKYIMAKNFDVKKEAELTEEYKRLKPLCKNARELMYEEVDLEVEQVEEIQQKVKEELNISMTAEEHYAEQRDIIQRFLDLYLRYNPDEHVRAAYKPNYEDPKRTPLKADSKDPETSIIPPDDTFARWKRYTEANYEYLRQATDDIYCEKADFEFAIAPLEVFTGVNKEDSLDKYREFEKKYANELEVELRCADFGNWSLLGPWQQNREVTDFYNENTELLKRIIDQAKEDTRIGQKLMTKRAKKEKKKLNTDTLPDGYTPPTELTGLGVRHAEEIKAPNIIPDEIPYDPEEPGKTAVEINVHNIRPVYDRKQRHIRSKINQWKFHTGAQKLGEQDVSGYTPMQYHKQQEKEGTYSN